jgi:hypothetical protein
MRVRAACPTSRPMRLRLCAATILAASAAVAVGCGGDEHGSGASGAIGAAELARFASTSAGAPTGRFSFEMSVALPGADEPLGVTGEGAFDAGADRASAAVDLSTLARYLGGVVGGLAAPGASGLPDFDDPAGWNIDVVHDRDAGYLRFPALDDELPEGKSWFRVAEGDTSVGSFDFGKLEQFTTNDPRNVLGFLRATTDEVETVGAELVRGVETTHYRAVVDTAELRASSGSRAPKSLVDRLVSEPGLDVVPVDVWVDAESLVRKLSLVLSRTGSGASGTGEASMQFELWDYGEPVEIDIPPPPRVADG